MKKVKIGQNYLTVPIIQGGMGIGVSLGRLAGSVMKEGGMGVISAANPGYNRPDFFKNSRLANLKQLEIEIQKAKLISEKNGLLAVNIMMAGTHYADYVKQAVSSGVDAIISGAGLPLDLPSLTKETGVAIAPIVSSAKAASLICRVWEKKYQVIPDFIVIEGPKAGGHLGYSKEELTTGNGQDLSEIFQEVKKVIATFEAKKQKKIPLFVAGGIFTGEDIASHLLDGADGVQMGTRFIGTYECDAPDSFKDSFLKAKLEDIQLVSSPVGMPGRAIRNAFIKTLEESSVSVKRCVNCLIPCNPKETAYCISEALMNAVNNREQDGLIFSGTNGYRIEKIVSVKELMAELINDYKVEMRKRG